MGCRFYYKLSGQELETDVSFLFAKTHLLIIQYLIQY